MRDLLQTMAFFIQAYGPIAIAVAVGLLIAWRVWGNGRTLKFICIGTFVGLLALTIGLPAFIYSGSRPYYDLRALGLILNYYILSLPAAVCGAIAGYVIERATR
jgi:hypothetical protein